MEASKLHGNVLSLLPLVQKNEGRKPDPMYTGVCTVSFWKNMLEIGNGAPQGTGIPKQE